MNIEQLMGLKAYEVKAKRTKKLNKDEKEAHLSELITKSRAGYENYKKVFLELQNAYMLENEASEILRQRNKSNIFIPKINAKSKYLITSLNEVYFSSERMADIETYINSEESIIKMWQEAIDFYSQKLNLFKIFQPLFLDAIVFGTSIAKVTWNEQSPLIEKIGIDELFFDPNARNNEDINYLVNELYLSQEQVKERQELGFYKKIDLSLHFNEKQSYEKIKLYDIYEKDGGNWFVCTLYENELLREDVFLKDGQPFIWGNMLPQFKIINDENFICAYGEAVMGAALNLQKEINITRNLCIDAVRSHITPKLVIPKSAGVSREDIETIGKPIYKAESGQITILPQPNIQSAISNLNYLESELTEVTGISPQNNGTHTLKNETATEISIKAQEGGKRVGDYIRQYNESFIEPLFDRFAMLIFKYGDDSFFNGFSRTDIPSFRFKIQTGTGAMNKEIKRAGIQSSMGVFSQLYQMYMSVQDLESAYKIIKANERLVRELLPILGIKNVSDYLGDAVQNEQESGQMQAQEQIRQENGF